MEDKYIPGWPSIEEVLEEYCGPALERARAEFDRGCAEALARGETHYRGYLIGEGVKQPFQSSLREQEPK